MSYPRKKWHNFAICYQGVPTRKTSQRYNNIYYIIKYNSNMLHFASIIIYCYFFDLQEFQTMTLKLQGRVVFKCWVPTADYVLQVLKPHENIILDLPGFVPEVIHYNFQMWNKFSVNSQKLSLINFWASQVLKFNKVFTFFWIGCTKSD